METDPRRASILIREEARRLGFNDCGMARVRPLEEEADRLSHWLEQGYQAGMSYMERHLEKRVDPGKLVPGARSVISVILNYHPSGEPFSPGAPKIARYAWGEDYHPVIREKLHALLDFINREISPVKGRVFVDSAPVLDRAWAALAGLGWIGKNSMLISRKFGSYIFIGEIICDLELATDQPVPDYCGSCTRCLDACPTGALVAPRQLDSNRCISYCTIEHRGEIPAAMKGKLDNWIFGCDICQEVCPWNLKQVPLTEPRFSPLPGLPAMKREDWLEMSEESFRERFRKSALLRAGYAGIRRNLDDTGTVSSR